MFDICLYHAECLDGFGAAYAVWKRFPNEMISFVPVRHGALPDQMDLAGKRVLMVDFTYRRAVMRDIARVAEKVTVIDHHKTAVEDLAGLEQERPNVELHFDMDRSGASLTWIHFHDEPVPEIIRYIEDVDLWRRELPDTDEIFLALMSHPREFEIWDTLTVEQLRTEGKIIDRFFASALQEQIDSAFEGFFAGYRVPICNASHFMASRIGAVLCVGQPFPVCYQKRGDRIYFSLRSDENGLDVGELAHAFGGGGHKHAAGFSKPPGVWPDRLPAKAA
jgi:oligoribonuclease NrnB/cAMP/cGMP phosphodiesterase (DHH superfamily)